MMNTKSDLKSFIEHIDSQADCVVDAVSVVINLCIKATKEIYAMSDIEIDDKQCLLILRASGSDAHGIIYAYNRFSNYLLACSKEELLALKEKVESLFPTIAEG